MPTLKQHISHTGSGARRFPLYEKYINWTPYQYAMNNPVSLKDDNGMFTVDDHLKIMLKAAPQADLSISQTLALATLTNERAVACDGYNSDLPEQHYDNESFKESDSFKQSKLETGSYSDLGEALHGAQDFYAHSNYAELATSYFSDKKVRTFSEAMQNKGFQELWKKNGTSGYYPDDTTPEGKKSHKELTKDSPHHRLYKYAIQAATQETVNIIIDWKNKKQ